MTVCRNSKRTETKFPRRETDEVRFLGRKAFTAKWYAMHCGSVGTGTGNLFIFGAKLPPLMTDCLETCIYSATPLTTQIQPHNKNVSLYLEDKINYKNLEFK